MSDKTLPQTFCGHPMLWLALYFALGVLARFYFLDSAFWIALSVVVAVILVSFAVRPAVGLFIPLIFVPLGMICYEIELDRITEDRIKRIYDEGRIASDEPVEIEGVLNSIAEPARDGTFFTLRAESLTYTNSTRQVSGNVRLFAPQHDKGGASEYERRELRYGSRIRVLCRLERAERFRNPGVRSRLEAMDRQGIDASCIVKSPFLVEKLGEEPVFLPAAWIYQQRQRMISTFRHNFSSRTAGVIIASLLGDKHFLDRHTADVFRDGGTFHVLVISGLHITFIGGLTIWVLSFFTKRRVWQFAIATVFLWSYTIAVGAEAPVVRASLMFTILIAARTLHRTSSLLNALGFSVLILLVWRPSDLFSPSFQLTVVSVAAIVGCAFPIIEKLRGAGGWTPSADTPLPPRLPRRLKRFCELLYWNEAGWRIENARQIWSANLFKSPYWSLLASPNLQTVMAYLFEGILVSVIVQIWMLPLLVVYFHRVSPSSVFLNLWVGLFLALESFAAVTAVLLSSVSALLAAPLILLTEFFNDLMMMAPAWLSEWQAAGFRLPVYTAPLSAIYVFYAVAVIVSAVQLFKWEPFNLTQERTRWARLLIASILMTALGAGFILFHPFSAPAPNGMLTVEFLDVGQGDSALVTFPNGETMLIDGGGRVSYGDAGEAGDEPDTPRIGETVVSEFLWEKGYSRVDYLVATHADADHVQGLVDVAANFRIGTILIGRGAPLDDSDMAELIRVASKRSVPVIYVGRGDEFLIGGANVSLLNPGPSFGGGNDASVVARVSFGSASFLLTGDIERRAELELIERYGEGLLADVVKVPHHGSRTSSTEHLLGMIRPKVALISVGQKSPYGHPHPDIVSRWQNAGAEVLTTGQKGTVSFMTDGTAIERKTYVP